MSLITDSAELEQTTNEGSAYSVQVFQFCTITLLTVEIGVWNLVLKFGFEIWVWNLGLNLGFEIRVWN